LFDSIARRAEVLMTCSRKSKKELSKVRSDEKT